MGIWGGMGMGKRDGMIMGWEWRGMGMGWDGIIMGWGICRYIWKLCYRVFQISHLYTTNIVRKEEIA